ncbi:MAG: hypothetical protein EOO54_23285 [Haliea sp.]|nr:MAG: hypothetical protein EOO54_23285 [Haliea sp.]
MRRLLADTGFFLVGDAGGHRSGRHENGRQVAEMERADQEARHDLVADTEHQRALEHVVGQCHGGGHRDHIAAEEAQFHAARSLGDAVAHGRHTAGHLGAGTVLADLVLDQRRVARERRMGRKHVVVGGDDGNVWRLLRHDLEAVVERDARHCMRNVGATHAVDTRLPPGGVVEMAQIRAAGRRAALADTVGGVCYDGLKLHRGGFR